MGRVWWCGGAWGGPGGHGSPRLALPRGAGLCWCPAARVFTALPPEGDLPSECHLSPLQVFEEEHHVLYLDHGGVIAAIKDTSIPLKILK